MPSIEDGRRHRLGERPTACVRECGAATARPCGEPCASHRPAQRCDGTSRADRPVADVDCAAGPAPPPKPGASRDESAQDRVRLPGVRRAVAEVAGPLPRVRRLELARRGARRRRGAGAVAGDIATRYAWRSARRPRSCTPTSSRRDAPRLSTGIGEFDRVLGGGIVPGSLVLLGGEPGHRQVDAAAAGGGALRARRRAGALRSGEESEHQIKSRGERLGVGDAPLYLLAETCIERILEEIARLKPALVVVDSVQTVFSLQVPVGARQHRPGARGGDAVPVRREGAQHADVPRRPRHQGRQPRRPEGARARRRHGALFRRRAAPLAPRRARGEEPVRRGQRARRLRDDRQRPAAGAEPVGAVPGRAAGGAPGSAVLCCVEGSRPMLVEVQALVSTSTYGNARRMAIGIDSSRLSLLLAVLEKRAGLEPGRRRRLRQHRRRHGDRRAGRRPRRRRRRGVERAQPAVRAGRRRCSARSGWAARSAASRRRRCGSARRRRWDSPAVRRCPDGRNVDRPAGPASARRAACELVGVRHCRRSARLLLA